MISWKKINQSEHEFEIKFLGALVLVALGTALFYFIDLGLNTIPDFKYLFINNAKSFWTFLFTLIVIIFITEMIYSKSLVGYDEETKKSIYPILLKIIMLTIYWCVWSFFCAWLTLTYKPLTTLVLITILILTVTPGFICFIISKRSRSYDIKVEEEIKRRTDENKYYPIVIYLDKKYYSGYYGLICLPVYLIALLIGYIF